MDLYIVIWLYCWWTYILLYGYIVGGPIYCYMVILLPWTIYIATYNGITIVDGPIQLTIWLYC